MAGSLDAERALLRQRQGAGARYDAALAPAQELDWARRGTAYFARQLNETSDADLDRMSLVPGVPRRQIVAHVGYQARRLGEIVEWSRLQPASPMPFEVAVQADEVRGRMSQPARALRHLFEHSAVHLDVEWRDLTGEQWDRSVTDSTGCPISVRATPWYRAVAIWLHSIDLGMGGRFNDMPAAFIERLLQKATGAKALADEARASATDRDFAATGSDPESVDGAGRTIDVARWLYRRSITERGRSGAASLSGWMGL